MALDHNFNKAANHIRAAASQGAELAVLPEYHLTGKKYLLQGASQFSLRVGTWVQCQFREFLPKVTTR